MIAIGRSPSCETYSAGLRNIYGDVQRDLPPAQFLELLLEQTEALPLDERAQQVDLVGARELGTQFGTLPFAGRKGCFALRSASVKSTTDSNTTQRFSSERSRPQPNSRCAPTEKENSG